MIGKPQLYMFRVTVLDEDGVSKEFLTDFIWSEHWRRPILFHQITRLFPTAVSFKVFDGDKEFTWDNNPTSLEKLCKSVEQYVQLEAPDC